MANSPGEMIKAVIRKLEEQSGKKYDWWLKTTRKNCPEKGHKGIVNWLKTEHGLTHYQAQWVAWGITDPSKLTEYDKPDKLMDDLYSGKKEHLRPVYDKLRREGLKLGKDVSEICCKTYSSLRNRAQFAVLAPRSQTYLDVELAMPPGTKAAGRLEAFKGMNDKYTHRIRIAAAKEVDREVIAAMKQASDHVRGK